MNESKLTIPLVSIVAVVVGILIGSTFNRGSNHYDAAFEEQLIEGEVAKVEQQISQNMEQPQLVLSQNELSLSQSKVLIKQLKAQVDTLSQRLSRQTKQNQNLQRKNTQLEEQLAMFTQKVNDLEQNDNINDYPEHELINDNGNTRTNQPQQDLWVPYLSKEQLSEDLPKDFHRFYDKKHRSLVEKYHQLIAQKRDEQWAYTMEQNINGFIISHPLANLQTFQVKCTEDMCRMNGSYAIEEQQAWDRVLNDLTEQPWYTFYSATGGSTSDGDRVLFMNIVKTRRQTQEQ